MKTIPIGKIIYAAVISLAIAISLAACAQWDAKIRLIDAKITTELDKDLMPVRIMQNFPANTSKVSCWIQWRDARINTQLFARWHYITDDIHIIDHTLNIPKKDGTGGVTLSMPEGSRLPSGQYKVDIMIGRRVLKTLRFKVE